MNIEELRNDLEKLNVDPNTYSLYGNLIPNTYVLLKNHYKWEVFYYDERGGRNSEKDFDSENEACNYLYRIFVDAINIGNKFGIKSI